jgi:alpha-tubulin suppressor-like RCC1 family protein
VQPTRVAGLDDVVGIAVAQGRSCATRSDGSVWCWGSNRVETGLSGAGETFHTPTRLAPLGPVLALRMGDTHTCALLRGGPLCCWGSDVRGQLGRGEYPRHALGRVPDATPVPVRW